MLLISRLGSLLQFYALFAWVHLERLILRSIPSEGSGFFTFIATRHITQGQCTAFWHLGHENSLKGTVRQWYRESLQMFPSGRWGWPRTLIFTRASSLGDDILESLSADRFYVASRSHEIVLGWAGANKALWNSRTQRQTLVCSAKCGLRAIRARTPLRKSWIIASVHQTFGNL